MTAQLERWQKEDAIRKAEVAFLTDRNRRSIEFWWEQLCKDLCSLPELRRRSQQGRWVARRERYWHNVTQEVLRDTKRRTVRDLVSELEKLQALHLNLYELASPYVIDGQKRYRVQPHSLEGVVRAFVSVDELINVKRAAALQQIEPEIEREMSRSKSMFSPDEIRGVARMLLEARRARQQQQQLLAHEGEHGSDGIGPGQDAEGKDRGPQGEED